MQSRDWTGRNGPVYGRAATLNQWTGNDIFGGYISQDHYRPIMMKKLSKKILSYENHTVV